KIITDTYARWYRLRGVDVRFLTGTDENGQKLVRAATDSGFASTKEYRDFNSDKFRKLCADLELTNDDFIRTTEERHKSVCQDLWRRLEAKGDVFFDRYSGYYCFGCEAFYLESQVEELLCPNHQTQLEFI